MRTEKRSSPQIRGDMVSLQNMVSPQNGDTRGGPPPPLATPLLSLFLSKRNFVWYSAVLPTMMVNSAVLPTLIVIVLQFDCFMFLFICFTQYHLYFRTSYIALSFIVCLYFSNGCHSFSVRCLFLLFLFCYYYYFLRPSCIAVPSGCFLFAMFKRI